MEITYLMIDVIDTSQNGRRGFVYSLHKAGWTPDYSEGLILHDALSMWLLQRLMMQKQGMPYQQAASFRAGGFILSSISAAMQKLTLR